MPAPIDIAQDRHRGRDMKRYQLYNHLMNISFWISIAYLVRLCGQLAGVPALPVPDLVYLGFGALTLANLFLAIFLVLARFMRDEFAERIWQLAATRFVYFLIAVPTVAAISLSLLRKQLRAAMNDSWMDPYLLAELRADPDVVWIFYGGAGNALILFSLFAPAVFVCLYRWCLWRQQR